MDCVTQVVTEAETTCGHIASLRMHRDCCCYYVAIYVGWRLVGDFLNQSYIRFVGDYASYGAVQMSEEKSDKPVLL